ncbi:MAG: ATP-binding protein [Bacteroidales bacterium]|nr:ATP-binding protein [Bacteroidales bacterium]
MLSLEKLTEIIIDSSKTNNTGIIRNLEIELFDALMQNKPITVVTGIRRSGKSYLLKNLYKKLLSEKIPRKNILFLNFEDDRLNQYLTLNGLRSIYELFIANTDNNKPVYLFFDEIQNVPEWEKFIRTLYDSTNHRIYITGSNAKLLSREFSSTLGGRLLEYTLYPFSFKEILQIKNILFTDPFTRAENKEKINKYLSDYLNYGGLPETFNLSKKNKMVYRKSLLNKIIINDILSRYNLHSVNLLSEIIYFLEKNGGKIISYRNIAQAAKSNENTIETYIGYLNTAYIIEKLKKFSWKTKAVFDKNKKFYFIDNLFCAEATVEKRMENLCYVHLLQNYGKEQLYLGRDERGKEIDFIIKTDKKITAIQVCYELNDENLKREISSLQLMDKHMNNTKKELKIIVMYNNVSKAIPENIKIEQLKDFLLN